MKKYTDSSSELLRYFLKPFYFSLFLGCGVMMLTDVCQLALPQIIADAIDHYRGIRDQFNAGELTKESALDAYSWHYLTLFVGICTVLFITRHYWRILTIGAARKMAAKMKEAFFDHLMTLSQEDIDEMKTGDLMTRVTSDIAAIERMVAFAFVVALDCFVHISAITVLLWWTNQALFLKILPLLIICPILFHFVRKKVYGATSQYQKMTADLAAMAEESFSGISVVKSFTTEGRVKSTFEGYSDDLAKQRVKIVFWESFLSPVGHLLIAAAIFVAIDRGMLQSEMSFKKLALFVLYLQMLIWPIWAIGMVVGMFQKGVASLDRMRQIFSIEPQQLLERESQQKELSENKEELHVKGAFKFDGLNFSFKNIRVLEDINFEISSGTKVGLIGAVGSGKSTLLSLIVRLYECEGQQIFLDGKCISQYPAQALRKRMGFVTQESFLFSETIKNNVLFGRNDEEDEETVREWLAQCQVLEDVEAIPQQLEAMLGERGVNLSGGQKQRLTLARALALEPDIYLFDDCFSALDASTEKSLLAALDKICEGHTTFIASHRMSTVARCDLILVMDQGRIVERGRPEDLAANAESYYAKILGRQLMEFDQ